MDTIEHIQRAHDIQVEDDVVTGLRDRPLDSLSQDEEVMLQQLQARRLQQLLDDMDEEAGPVSTAVARDVDALDWPTS